MNALMAVAGFITVAAVTPGPNNLVVMRTAMRAGILGALPAIAGVVVGGIVLLSLATLGLGGPGRGGGNGPNCRHGRRRLLSCLVGCVFGHP
jgi:hypothetical protein